MKPGILWSVVSGLLTLLLLVCSPDTRSAENMLFKGTLVAEPCRLEEQSEVRLGDIVNRYLYLNTRTLGEPLLITLHDCDLSLGEQVKVTISGTESRVLPGLLSLEGSGVSGVALGIELPDGTPLPLNRESPLLPLVSGDHQLTLRAYIQGEPDALRDNSITLGAFQAVATFSLEYD